MGARGYHNRARSERGSSPDPILRPLALLGSSAIGYWPDHHLDAEMPEVELMGEDDMVVDMKFFPDAGRLATAGRGGTVVIWDILSGHALQRLPPGHLASRPVGLEVLPDGEELIVLGENGQMTIWCVASGKVVQIPHDATRPYSHSFVRVVRGGDMFITWGPEHSQDPALLWSMSTGAVLHELEQPDDPTRVLEVSPCGQKVVTAGFATISVWDAGSGHREREITCSARLSSALAVAWGATRVVMTSLNTRRLFVWDGRTGEVEWDLTLDGMPILRFAFLGDNDRIVAFSSFKVFVWDLRSGQLLHQLGGDGSNLEIRPEAVVVSGDIVAACGLERSWMGGQMVIVWDARTGRQVHTASREVPIRAAVGRVPGAVRSGHQPVGNGRTAAARALRPR
eukprot:CAMPEP_0176021160 /NCGR_PEP_ID=MMETSP0120_2-20121206/10268_1 /TAXON_ID=160619 /ORGANISM="Kryptoperidinium foliaceum, Strain CCMP 1326" /LENGTH=396 /DNA_ID=CAMNT_0017354269 /DNA_START=62 /DNA_END=1249 /DNA_ORIENTATION=-